VEVGLVAVVEGQGEMAVGAEVSTGLATAAEAVTGADDWVGAAAMVVEVAVLVAVSVESSEAESSGRVRLLADIEAKVGDVVATG
jgi:hypothetical protein